MRFIIWILLILLLSGRVSWADQSLAERLAVASIEAGKNLSLVCQACHTLDAGAENRIGPNLYSVINREVAGAAGFRYSDAMRALGGQWSPEQLDLFLADPVGRVPGTAMAFTGISDAQDRANLIAYLNTLSDAPMDLGVGSGEPMDSTVNFGQLFVAEGVEVTYYTCTACHSEMIVAQQGKNREDWDELLDWMIEEQGMNDPSAEDRAQILDYLSAHYNIDRPNFPR